MSDPFDSPTFRLIRSIQKQQEKWARLADPFGFASQANNWAKIHQNLAGSPLDNILGLAQTNKAVFGGIDPDVLGMAKTTAMAALPQSPLLKLVEQNQRTALGGILAFSASSLAAAALPAETFMSRLAAISKTAMIFEESGLTKAMERLRPVFSAAEAANAAATLGGVVAGIPELSKIAPIFPRALEALRADPDRFRDPEARANLQRELAEEGEGTGPELDPNVIGFIISLFFFMLSYVQSEANDQATTASIRALEAQLEAAGVERTQIARRQDMAAAQSRALLLRVVSLLEPVSSGCVVELVGVSPARLGRKKQSPMIGQFEEGQSVLLLRIEGKYAQVRGELAGEEATVWIAKKKLPKNGRCSLAEVFRMPEDQGATPPSPAAPKE